MSSPRFDLDRLALRRGGPPAEAERVVVAVHGRGADAADILGLAGALPTTGTTWLAPEAAARTWYPYSFMAPLAANQPSLDQALRTVASIVAELEAQGVPASRIVLLGFSQGACLALESVARLGRPLGGVIAFSGGRIGPDGITWPEPPAGSAAFAGMPVFLGCSDRDPHIPLARVRESAAFFRATGARVDERIYPGMPHTINDDELAAAADLLAAVR